MRILMLSWEYPPHLTGGLGAHVMDLVPALAEQGVEVTLLTPGWRGGEAQEYIHPNTMVYRVPPIGDDLGDYFGGVRRTNTNLEYFAHTLIADGQTFDLIHAHDWLVSFSAEALKNVYKLPLVATIHATERGRGRGFLENRTAEAINSAEWRLSYEAWRVIATSRFMAREICTYFDLPSDKLSIIPNGVNITRRPQLSQEERDMIRFQWVEPQESIVYYIGRIQQEKGMHLLIDAAAQVLAQDPHVKFILAGTGGLLGVLRHRVDELGIADRVILPGYVSNKTRDQLYQAADVAVFPSLYEPFGIVALEAMAAHCPVIVSDVGGLGEVVEDGETGLKVEPGRVDLLAQAILKSLHNRKQAYAMAAQAFTLVEQEYSWSQIARATMELYQDVIRLRQNTVWE